MDKKTYLQNPCGASSLPFWKTNCIQAPDDLLILREDDPRIPFFEEACSDTLYFKLIHHMEHIEQPTLPDGYRFVCPSATVLSDHISSCYVSDGASAAELESYRDHRVYSPDLWLAIVDEQSDRIIASGIAEIDLDIREGILEWIQVSPEYRRRGWGRIIVNELLLRMRDRSDFVTVSGKANDTSDPRALYERCGFEGAVIWHVLRKRQSFPG